MSSSRRKLTSEKSGIRFDYDQGDGDRGDGEGAQVNLNSLISRFETIDASRQYNDELPELELPGHGERYDDCGDELPRFCSACGSCSNVGRTCFRSGCPRCWKGWDRKRATTITSKLEALRAYKDAQGAGWQGDKFHHLTLSAPDGFRLNSDEPLQRTFDLLKGVLDELGASTGYLFYHPFRTTADGDRGAWKDLLPDGDPVDWDDTRQELAHEPHFHAVVISKHVTGGFATKHLEEKTGWVVERITKGENSDVSIYDQHDLARVVTYCLSHTGIGDRAAYRAFGEVANFTADEKFKRGMDAAVRSVAPKTLGLEYSSLACQEQKLIDVPGQIDAGIFGGDGDGDQPDQDEPDGDPEDNDCNGRLLEIKKAPAFINNEEWTAEAPHADELKETWKDWRFRVDSD